MDDGEIDFSNQEVLTNSIMGEIGGDCSMDSLFDDLMNDTHVFTHMHTCNMPGPDNAHTHTCVRVHTKIVPTLTEERTAMEDTGESEDRKGGRRPIGNREAVRKYREKKKARVGLLEQEVVRLRAVNQQLMKRLQGRSALEAEVARLKCLLVDVRGRIDGEIGCFPYQNAANANVTGSYVMNHCNVPCDDQFYCPYAGGVGKGATGNDLDVHGFTCCEFDDHQCLSVPIIETLVCDAQKNGGTNVSNTRKGGGGAANGA